MMGNTPPERVGRKSPSSRRKSGRELCSLMAKGLSKLLELVAELHEGVVDDAAWQRAIGDICAMLDIPQLLVGAISRGGKSVEFEFGYRAAPSAVALLEGPLADPAHNPWLALASRHPLRRVASMMDIGGYELLKTTRMWEEFYIPFRVGDTVGAPLERQPDYNHVLIAARRTGKPDFRASDRRRLEVLLPHIARAWRVRRALLDMESAVGSLKLVLDRLDRAIVVAEPDGKVRFANRAAERLLSRGDAIDARNSRLCAVRPKETEVLRALIGRAAATASGEALSAVDAVALPSDGDHPPLAVVAEPLAPAHSERFGHRPAAGAIVFIGDSETSRCPPPDRLRIVYGLTPAEAKLMSLVIKGEGVASAGRTLGISQNTAKFHLKAVFDKVGVSTQAQLVRRALADVGGLAEPNDVRRTDQAERSPAIRAG